MHYKSNILVKNIFSSFAVLILLTNLPSRSATANEIGRYCINAKMCVVKEEIEDRKYNATLSNATGGLSMIQPIRASISYKCFWDVTKLEWSCVVDNMAGISGPQIITFKNQPTSPGGWCVQLFGGTSWSACR